MKPNHKQALKLYASGIALYAILILLTHIIPFYQRFLNSQTKNILIYLFLGYALFSPIYYLLTTKEYTTSKPLLFFRFLNRTIKHISIKKRPEIEPEEKVALLFVAVKLFFLPLMFEFFTNNIGWFIQNTTTASWFPIIITVIFTIDTFIFALAYTFEFQVLGNIVKSVEPTFLGWFATVICYPPFNSITGNYIPWGASDSATFGSETTTMI